MNPTFISIFLISFFACKQRPHTDSTFSQDINRFFSRQYSLASKYQSNTKDKDSLRAKEFFSPDLLEVTFFNYRGKFSDSLHSSSANFSITVYEYSSVETAKNIVEAFEKEKQKRTEEGLYGPIDKNYQYFLQGANYLVHFEALCSSSKEGEWFEVQNSLTKITVQHFGEKYKAVIKGCE